jgi:hypothetical protein
MQNNMKPSDNYLSNGCPKSLLRRQAHDRTFGGSTTITIFPFPAKVLTTIATINIF